MQRPLLICIFITLQLSRTYPLLDSKINVLTVCSRHAHAPEHYDMKKKTGTQCFSLFEGDFHFSYFRI